MHLLSEFGMSVREIEEDGFHVDERVHMTYDGYTGGTMAKSLGSFLLELPTLLQRLRPDILLLAGDRGEQLIAAIAGVHMNIVVAHIQAGELSGNVDGIVRHAITKLAHVHFAANEEFAQRVRMLGEEDTRIHVTGAPLLDELVQGEVTDESIVRARYGLDRDAPFLLAVEHPVTEQEDDAVDHMRQLLLAIIEVGLPTVLIYPNADAGSLMMREEIQRARRPTIRIMRNVARADYLGLMRGAEALVGNSSSGIMEAPTFGTPAVNIGRRQVGRTQAANVLNVGHSKADIVDAIRRAMTPEFRRQARAAVNPYGDGSASQRIVEVLRKLEVSDALRFKEMTY
jgi:UDP-hydrolysing UDP-N-acetyl-D-glucosamine 2-epimerase